MLAQPLKQVELWVKWDGGLLGILWGTTGTLWPVDMCEVLLVQKGEAGQSPLASYIAHLCSSSQEVMSNVTQRLTYRS